MLKVAGGGGGGGSGTVTQVDTGTGLTGGPITTTGTVSLANTAVTAAASAASLSGVLVPCAFTWPMSVGDKPASASANSMHLMAPVPPGAGAVMW